MLMIMLNYKNGKKEKKRADNKKYLQKKISIKNLISHTHINLINNYKKQLELLDRCLELIGKLFDVVK